MTRSLFQPIQIGAVTLRNRVLMSALTRNRALPTNVPNELMVEYYRQRAESAGLIVSEGILICQQGYVCVLVSREPHTIYITPASLERNGPMLPEFGTNNR